MGAKQLYSSEYQDSFLAHALCDTDFLKRVHDTLDPTVFGNDLAQRLLRIVQSFYEQQHAAPGDLVLEVLASWGKKGLIPEKLVGQVTLYAQKLLALPRQHRRYLLERYDDFLKARKLVGMVTKLVEIAKKEQLDEADKLIFDYVRAAHKSTAGRSRDAGFYDPDPSARAMRRAMEDTDLLWLLIQDLDARNVNLKRGHLGMFMSQFSGAGKSVALAHVVKSAVMQGKKVLYLVLGEMTKDEIEDRLDSMIAGLSADELDGGDRLRKRLLNLFRFSEVDRPIHIATFPAKSMTVSALKLYAREIENTESFKADLVVIDYMDNLRPQVAKTDDMYGAGAEIAADLKAWAQEDYVYMWTALQSKTDATEVVTAGMQHAGGSRGKPEQADLFITINRTPEEIEKGVIRLYVAKRRHKGGAGFTATIRCNLEQLQFYLGSWRFEDEGDVGPPPAPKPPRKQRGR